MPEKFDPNDIPSSIPSFRDDGIPLWWKRGRYFRFLKLLHESQLKQENEQSSRNSEMKTEMITDPKSGGTKGQKHCDLSTIPPEVMLELGKVYANGRVKYGRSNFLLGYNWSLSADALLRHFWQWMDGERDTTDDEVPVHHLAAVAWHALCLMAFDKRDIGTDDIRGLTETRLKELMGKE